MKVLVITTSYPDFEGSTRGIFIRRLCQELAAQGIEVLVLTPRTLRSSPLFEEEPGIRVHRFRYPSGNTQLNQLKGIPVLPMGLFMLSGLAKALSLVIRERPCVIHGNWIVPTGLIASVAGLLTRTPVINSARGMDLRVSEKGLSRTLFDLAVKLSDRVTVVSGAMKERPCLAGAEVITSGVDPSFFTLSPDYGSRTILHSRSLEQVYDVATLIRAMPLVLESIPDARLVVAGTGSQERALRELASALGVGDTIEFLGAVPNGRIASLMAGASVYASSATADGTSIALLEALAAGLIPVVTGIAPNRAFVTHGTDGFLFEPGNEKDLAACLVRALQGEIPAGELGKKRDALRDRIAWRFVADRYAARYRELAEGSPRLKS
jgi:glycosyltransferase involved in cell wall biosynthesis